MEAQQATTESTVQFNHGEVAEADNADLQVTLSALEKAETSDTDKFAQARQAILNKAEHSSRHHAVSVDVDTGVLKEAHDKAIEQASVDVIARPFENIGQTYNE